MLLICADFDFLINKHTFRGTRMSGSHLIGGTITIVLAAGVALSIVEPAFATAIPVPGPIVGAGLPVLAVLGGGYWLIRKLRERR
jgi:hypothetical protein